MRLRKLSSASNYKRPHRASAAVRATSLPRTGAARVPPTSSLSGSSAFTPTSVRPQNPRRHVPGRKPCAFPSARVDRYRLTLVIRKHDLESTGARARPYPLRRRAAGDFLQMTSEAELLFDHLLAALLQDPNATGISVRAARTAGPLRLCRMVIVRARHRDRVAVAKKAGVGNRIAIASSSESISKANANLDSRFPCGAVKLNVGRPNREVITLWVSASRGKNVILVYWQMAWNRD